MHMSGVAAPHRMNHLDGGTDALAVVAAPGTLALDGAPPSSWTDLDLSSIVGANVAIVCLAVVANQSGAAHETILQAKGEPLTTNTAANYASVNICDVRNVSGSKSEVITYTDASGYVQIMSTSNYAIKVYVQWYILVH